MSLNEAHSENRGSFKLARGSDSTPCSRASASAPTRLNAVELVCTILCVLRHKSSSVVELSDLTHTLFFFVTQLQSRGNL